MHKKLKIKKIILAILIVLILIAISIIILINRDNNGNTTIIATKSISDESKAEKEMKYEIKINDYTIESIEKELTFETKEKAQLEYDKYQIINEYERKDINVQIKKKKLLMLMTEDQFKEDIGYDEENNITSMTQTGEQKEIMDQEEIINDLVKQGYTIK